MLIKVVFLTFLIVFYLLDLYFFERVKTIFPQKGFYACFKGLHWVYYLFYALSVIFFSRGTGTFFTLWFQTLVGGFVLLYAPKLLLLLPMLIEDFFRLLKGIFLYHSQQSFVLPSRNSWVGWMFFISFWIMMLGIVHGIVWGKYRFQYPTITIVSNEIPKNFNDYRIIQISDLHAGSFLNPKVLEPVVAVINSKQPDLIVFTGDFVNLISEELVPFVPILKKLKAKDGAYAILGNHDYGWYFYEKTDTISIKKNRTHLLHLIEQMNWKVLNDEHVILKRGNDSLYLAGVENIGYGRFPHVGSLDKSIAGIPVKSPIILLSHDPTHFEKEVQFRKENIFLTLSGHTHGSQFGIEWGSFRWSPSQYLYKFWAGKYQINDKYLYVNRGVGFNAFSGRVGIYPEVTEIILKRSK